MVKFYGSLSTAASMDAQQPIARTAGAANSSSTRAANEVAEEAYARFEAEAERDAAVAVAAVINSQVNATTGAGSSSARDDAEAQEWSSSDGEEDVPSAVAYSDACKKLQSFPCRRWLAACASRKATCELGHYGVGPSGAVPLSISLAVNAHICKLDLSDNRLGADGIVAVLGE